MKRTYGLRSLALVGVVALAAAACGPDDPDVGASEESESVAPSEPSESDSPSEALSPSESESAGQTDRQNVDGTLTIGQLLPSTGDLAVLGPPMIEAMNLAVSQINEAGGVLGQDVVVAPGDDGTNPDIANDVVDEHLNNNNVDAILGPAASSVTLAVIDKISGAGVVQCSPSNTGSNLTTYEDNGFYFRTAPADNLQAQALSQLIVEDGYSSVAIIALNDEYGQGFAGFLEANLTAAGATVVANVPYDPAGTEFDADVQEVADAAPDAVALLSFPNTGSKVLQGLIENGVGPADVQIYTADGMQSGDVAALVDPDDAAVLDGMKGTAPTSQGSEEFSAAFEAFAPEGTAQIFSAHAYDCAILFALAAEAAQTDDPSVFVEQMNAVTLGGEKCMNFADCKALLDEGADIDYDGAAGPLDFVEAGEPGAGTYEVWAFDSTAEGGYTTAGDPIFIAGT